MQLFIACSRLFQAEATSFRGKKLPLPATNLAAGQEPSSFHLLLLLFKARNPCHILFYGLHGKKFATISCCRQETAATSAHALEGKNLLRSSTACQRLFATWSSRFFLPPTQPLVQENAADAFRSWPGKNLLRGKSQRLKTCQHFFCNVCTSSMADLTFEKWIIFIFIIGMLCLSFIIHALMKGKLTFILWIIMTASNPSLSKSIIEDPMCTNLPSSCKSLKPAKEYLYKISNSFFCNLQLPKFSHLFHKSPPIAISNLIKPIWI